LIENSLEATKRGASLTQRMLAFARRQELKMELVDVPERVRNMAELLQGSIGADIQINTQFPLRIKPAIVDANQLELAILNLAVNARDAMSGGGALTIAAQEVRIGPDDPSGLKPGEYICLSVTDTGEGMDEETLKRAVEPFFTTKGIGKGTGLGLSMIHGFAEQSAGRLVLKSVKGQGTRAELWLPVADQVIQPGPEPQAQTPRQKRAPRKLCVLVVDDDPLVLMNTAAMLEDLGHDVLEATSGEQALRMLRRGNGVDLVITDQLMPGMTGSQLIAVIRSERPELPIILATGYSDVQAVPDASLPRLAKPFFQADLARVIATATEPEGQVLAFRPK
jgi:CheY-like chemotaxis protein